MPSVSLERFNLLMVWVLIEKTFPRDVKVKTKWEANTEISLLSCMHVLQGDANRSESDDDKKSDNFDEDEKIEQFRATGNGVFMIFLFCFYS